MKMKRIFLKIDYSKLLLEIPEANAPYMDAYLLDDNTERTKRPAVIICPGGGYNHLSPREAEPVAMQFLKNGIQAFVLYYSVKPAVFPMQLMEAALAVKYIRDHSNEWSIESNQIAIMGFSAGGNLAATLSCMWQQEFLTDALKVNKEEIRPNACILCYAPIRFNTPVYEGKDIGLLQGLPKEYGEITDLRKRVTKNVPPTFMFYTWEDETVPVSFAIEYQTVLFNNGISCETHIFRRGRHGLSLATRETLMPNDPLETSVDTYIQQWLPLCMNWLDDIFQ